MIVVDTSVAIPWLVAEDGAEFSEELLGRPDLAAPDILLLETANVLRKKLLAREIAEGQLLEGIEFVRSTVERLVPTIELVRRGAEIAVAASHPVYDCVFLACAERVGGVVATRDHVFVNRAQTAQFGHLVQLAPFPLSAARQ